MAQERPKARVSTTLHSPHDHVLKYSTYACTQGVGNENTRPMPSPDSSIGTSCSSGWWTGASRSTSVSTVLSSIVPTASDKVIVLMGQTGSGKSTFINCAVGHDVAKVTHAATSCTDAIRLYQCAHPNDPHSRVFLVDTPGFDNTKAKSPRRVLQQVSDWLIASYKKEVKLAGILQLVDITQARVTGSHRTALQLFSELCGLDFMSNVVVVSTCWEDLDDTQVGAKREANLQNMLADHPGLNGIRHVRLEERTKQAVWDVMDLLRGPERVLCIQSEVVDQRKPLEESSAFRSLRRVWNLLR